MPLSNARINADVKESLTTTVIDELLLKNEFQHFYLHVMKIYLEQH